MSTADHSARSTTRRVRRRMQREGAVMLIVMLILLVATALASVALQGTQHELRASGFNRAATQTQYIAESTLITTLAYVDGLAEQNQLTRPLLCPTTSTGLVAPPVMSYYGEPEIDINLANRHFATRTEWVNQRVFFANAKLPPLTGPGYANAGVTDPIGTLGPQDARRPGAPIPANSAGTALVDGSEDYSVDLYDCQTLQGGATAGQQVAGQSSGNSAPFGQYYCVVTARGRTYVPGALAKTWTIGTQTYTANRLAFAHDARSTIITGSTTLGCGG